MTDDIADLAIGLRLTSLGGLRIQYDGIRRFDLAKTPLSDVAGFVARPDFPWDEPHYGEMRSALTIGLDRQNATLLFVLGPSLDAGFCSPPVQPGNEWGKIALSDAKLWPPTDDEAWPTIASVVIDVRALAGEGFIKFNLAVANVGEVGKARQRYCTPIVIDPDVPYPPTGGGALGGDIYP